MHRKLYYLFFFPSFWSIIKAASLNLPPSIQSQPSNKDTVYFDRSPPDPDADKLVLPCKANGSEPLTYSWRLNEFTSDININDVSKYQKGADGDLEFVRPVQQSTIGFYQCFAKNTFGTALSNKVNVKLYTYPVSASQPISFTATEGSSYHLQCTFPNRTDPKPLFKWQTVASFQDQNPRDLSLNDNMRLDENGTLYFSYLQRTDNQQGRLYRCQIQNPYSNAQISFVGYSNLTVVPSNPTTRVLQLMFKSYYPIFPLVSEQVALYCFFEGAIDIKISWELPTGNSPSGTRYETLGNMLIIKSLVKTDMGDYKCVGTSATLGTTKKEVISLNVKEKPVFEERPYDTTTSQNTNIVFHCSARADPPAVYTWYRNGELMQPGSLRSNLELSADNTQLTIKNVCKDDCTDHGSDLAVYQCKASNEFGSILANGYVGVLVATHITTSPSDVLFDPTKIPKFVCVAETDEATTSRLTYTWLFNGKIVNNGNFNTTNSVLTIPLSESSRYIGQWTCNVTDGFSYDSKSAQLYQPATANIWPYWWIPFVVILLLLLFILLVCIICCCLYSNRGDDYPVDDIEQKVGNNPVKELSDSGFHDYQRQGLLPRTGSVEGATLTNSGLKIKRSQGSLSGSLGNLNSDDDSLAYSNINPTKFNEDGSFINRYNTGPRQTYA